jgi:hypothetical protein
MRIFQAQCMREKRHARFHAAGIAVGGRAPATCGCLARGKRFLPLFSIVVYNEKSSFWLNNA